MLVLASSSPRRAMLLREGGYTFETVKASVSEVLTEEITPEIGVRQLAVRKAQAGLTHWLESGGNAQDVVLGADTMVVLDGRILGKPTSTEEAVETLKHLSGRTHEVLTGVSLVSGSGRLVEDVVKTIVHFRPLETDEITSYVASGEPMDKAGAYGIQGGAGKFVTSIQGSLTNVIGLPMEYLTEQLKAWGIGQINIASREVDDGLSAFEGFTGGTFAP
ncbi:nucleoside triphosphate pyrophosphatase [Desulfosporosinus sp. BICA1-9]|uniref:Maf family protein n=1 Tax=Desulfosporosinus sp. BICA1-9 TaxID=1531958 RepID=UPI00054BA39D|nr:Maf family protein [Desulfosporosinus sp. BICA1-9]KJS50320.1 MAG: septum formation inhibitor Maf [Peptococcaceae bacterium BRH_c23]KJS88608.1 MAG: septum formation inhibitor Maf [Desulfosporosinus sp. BICA1-9]HBW34382.1 septum formation inhibitor Maf [Desulfosporosinus sp.]